MCLQLASASGAALKPAARKKLILAYERRMDQLVTHPLFGYRISYRRVLEVQARLLSRVLFGDPNHTVREGHDIAHAVERRLLSGGPNVANVLLHVEPADDDPDD